MKKTIRIFKIALAAACVVILLILGTFVYMDRTMDRSGWLQRDGRYYYLSSDGQPLIGWQELDGSRYYFGPSGAMLTGWQEVDGMTYCFSAGGVMQTGWADFGDRLRWLNSSGNPVSGWQNVEGQRRWFQPDGTLGVGWQTIDGGRYYLSADGTLVTGWLDTDEGTWHLEATGIPTTGHAEIDGEHYYFYAGSGMMHRGWLDIDRDRYYYSDLDGRRVTGWQTIDGKDYCFDDSGVMQTGWYQDGEYRYYLLEDGGFACGPTEIDGETCFFTPDGIYVLLVNYRYPLPKDYRTELVRYEGSWQRVSAEAEQHLKEMMADCRATGISVYLNCGYRTQEEQTAIMDERVSDYVSQGMDLGAAQAKARETVAVPGYSEHQTGLAMDIVCSVSPDWLHEHCWEYGFILRYPEGKSDITQIAYEHWHYRYVGTRVSMAMKDTGLCLEEFLNAA